MSTQQFSDADRLGCEGCPGNPENREYSQQRGVSISGVDGRPKANPGLEAIDSETRVEEVVIMAAKRIADLEAQLVAEQKPRVMKRWGADGVPAPGVMCWLLVGGIMHKESLSDNEIRQCRIAGCSIPGEISHWLELEPAPTLPEPSDDMSSLAGDGDA